MDRSVSGVDPPILGPMGRRIRILLATAVLVVAPTSAVGVLVSPASVGAQSSTVSVGRSTLIAPNDYFTSMWHDPLDFSNAEDFDTTPNHMVMGGNSNLAFGSLNISGAQQVFLLRSDPGSYPTSATRDPRSRPLDAARFRRVTFRMYSDRNTDAAIYFRQCNSCADGLKYFRVRAGWHSYDLDMTGPWDMDGLESSSLPPVRGAAWAGRIEMMWMVTSYDAGNLPNLSIDDMRIVEPTADLPVNVNAGSGQVDLWMDLDGNQGNDGSPGPAGQTASRVGTVNATGLVGLPSGLLRRGETARFYTVRNGVRSASSAPVSMPATSSPSPRVLTPWEGGGEDWATVVRWDPWDMDQPSDVAAVRNAGAVYNWGILGGWTTGPVPNDPAVVLNTNGKPIDGQLFHKMAITINYDGPWGLQDGPGGGMVGRLMWKPWGSAPLQVSDDIVLKTGQATYYVEMRPWPPWAVLDPGANPQPIGWGTGRATWISSVEFHPHEDRGARTWQIQDVKLLRNDYVDLRYGGFDIKYLDDAWAPGTTADIIADPDRDPYNAGYVVLASGVAVGPGINTYKWNGWPAGPGTYNIRVIMHRNGETADSYSTGQVDYGPAPAPWPPPVK